MELPRGRRWACLSVRDTGRGMDEATRLRVFEPFFTTKPVGQGTGLGLAMVFGTVQGHDGAIEVDSTLGVGTTFRIYLPVVDSVPERPPARTESGRFRRHGVAMVVDDEPMIRAVTSRILTRMGLDVISAGNGAEALALFERQGGEIAIVVLDMSMPVMSGPECFRRLRERSRVPILLVSGFAADRQAQELLTSTATGFLDKPFTAAELGEHVERILGGQISPQA